MTGLKPRSAKRVGGYNAAMAITGLSYTVLRTLREHKLLPDSPAMIEMGESNWYGDVPLQQLAQDIQAFVTDADKRDELLRQLHALDPNSNLAAYEVAKIFFRGIGGCTSVESIDPGEPGSTYKFDLNLPVPLQRTYQLVMNYGTGEHVFNVMQFYKTVHELTEAGGVMIHSAPMTGWVDHGFYNFQPTFFMDLAQANGYDMLLAVVASLNPFKPIVIRHREQVVELAKAGQLPDNAMIEVALRKKSAQQFIVPMQGYYAGILSPAARAAWHSLR
jgi:hypothetical protein